MKRSESPSYPTYTPVLHVHHRDQSLTHSPSPPLLPSPLALPLPLAPPLPPKIKCISISNIRHHYTQFQGLTSYTHCPKITFIRDIQSGEYTAQSVSPRAHSKAGKGL